MKFAGYPVMAGYTVLAAAGDPAKSALNNNFLLEISAFSILQEKPKKFRIDSEWPETERNWKKNLGSLVIPHLKKRKIQSFFLVYSRISSISPAGYPALEQGR